MVIIVVFCTSNKQRETVMQVPPATDSKRDSCPSELETTSLSPRPAAGQFLPFAVVVVVVVVVAAVIVVLLRLLLLLLLLLFALLLW